MTKFHASNAHMHKLIDVLIVALPKVQYENRAQIFQPAGDGE